MAQGEELRERAGRGSRLRGAVTPLIAFVAIGMVAVVGFVGVSALVERGTDLGYELNVAARQRMFAHRAGFYAHLLSEEGHDDQVTALKLFETLDVMERSYRALLDGGTAPGLGGGEIEVGPAPPGVQEVFREPPHELGAMIERFVTDGRRLAERRGEVIEASDPQLASFIATMEGPLLDRIEASLSAYEREIVRASHRSRTLTAVAVGGLVLAVTAVFGALAGRRRARAARRAAEAEVLRSQKERYHALFEHSSDIVVLTDLEGKVLEISSSAHPSLGLSDGEAIGRSVFAQVDPDEQLAMRRTFAELLDAPGRRADVEVTVVRTDGARRRLHIVGHNLTHVPTVGGVVLNCHDVTERRAAEEARRSTEERFRAAAEGSFDAFAILEPVRDADGRVVDWVFVDVNTRYVEHAGRPREEIVGQPLSVVSPAWVTLGLVDRYAAAADNGVAVTEEVLFDGFAREATWYELTIVPLGGGGVAVTARDITARKREERELHHRAHHDVLTGLPNRAVLMDRLEYVLSGGGDPRVAVLFVDLDRFKDVNDAFGHEGGDTMLRQVADRLRTAVRAGDTVTRLGGDEFVVLCERVREPSEAEEVAARIVDALNRPFPFGTDRVVIGASVGLAIAETGQSANELLRQADNAVYQAKRDGGGCVVRHTPQSVVAREPVGGP